MKFSIVTPSLNQGRFLRDCIESVQAQTLVEWEHIVIDAGSTDETLDVLPLDSGLRLHALNAVAEKAALVEAGGDDGKLHGVRITSIRFLAIVSGATSPVVSGRS